MITELQRRTEFKLLETAQYFFEEAADRLGLERSLRELLAYPKRKFIVVFPVVMDDGRVESFEGYRVQHHLVLGPCKGGVRYHPEVTLEEIEALAILATWEAALLELPFSGAKGGVRCDPKRLSLAELERLTRRYAAEIAPLIGPEIDIPEPDLYTSEREMAWILDTLSMHAHGQYLASAVTGKPVVLSGSFGREHATGRGAFFIAREVLKTLGISPKEARVAIQGFGHSGKSFAQAMHAAGARVIAVSDSRGGTFCAEGLDIPKLLEYKHETGSVVGFAEAISNSELLTLPCDLLAPAAIENQITEENAGAIKARAILELAYGPTTLEADRILYDRDILVVPDILVNAGGVTVSYFEWVQSRTFDFWSPAQVEHRLKRFMRRAFRRVQAACEAEKTDLRTAAYCLAVKRVADAARARGLYA
ncbi:MAG: Glu/Leu/Phe/Val dehydrogenase [Candidatus Bipolaricaulota bacterium]|nr:Glu/Leu/Phe/Val dehydrogenase [Candidatus Bipolaricaulota bacterium]MCS7274471.1 Glu/Leu/Phe/Val dehydrogenase [Candidatus Bipolaricaulota bacterium]MDW8110900.1 Glu/Leu/Phe/Val dehydrogenase [Candidatus Bipolaricaulota bacterium]MDW8329333.1 Glu/Leu/Phe/Val dehydrogenase [Candidatus Bipolaricaulota bacterium]